MGAVLADTREVEGDINALTAQVVRQRTLMDVALISRDFRAYEVFASIAIERQKQLFALWRKLMDFTADRAD